MNLGCQAGNNDDCGDFGECHESLLRTGLDDYACAQESRRC